MLTLSMSPTLAGEFLYWGEGFSLRLGSDIVKSIVVGYMLAAGYYGLREAVRDFKSLRPALTCNDIEFDHWLNRLRHVARVPLYAFGVLALGQAFSEPLADTGWIVKPPLWSAEMSVTQIREFLVYFFIWRTIALEIISAFLFASVARRFARIELLDLERVAPFSRRALRAVLVLMLYMALQSLMAIFETNATESMAHVVHTSVLAAAIFLIPLYPLHQRIDAAKREELAHVHAAIRRESIGRNVDREGWVSPDASLTNLIVYKQQVEQVNTWIFNTPTALRFALYASLGIGSWLGAAFVERWLGNLLGS